jgi:NTE family protein
MRTCGRRVFSLIATLGIAGAASSAPDHPKIGLVLEGGGARGCAHVGVLRVLEEERIPIDFIAGTSMGAIVGGLYAAGMSPAEIEEKLATTDWDDVFTDSPPRKLVSFRRKEDDGRYLKDLQFGFKRGSLIFPPGFISGQKLGYLLAALTLNVSGTSSFDSLRIPFRAVATDIVEGTTVVLDHGDLVDAMRASMSVPGVFSPVEIEGRLLVDGGLTANLPVDVVRAMGAEIVIAVDIGSPLSERGEINSAIGVSKQVIGIMTRGNVDPQLASADFVIRPDLDGFSGLRFSRAQEMVHRGETAARSMADSLRFVADGREEFDAYLARIRRPAPAPIPVDFVMVEGGSRVDARRLEGRLRSRPGKNLDVDLLGRDLTRVYDIGEFERVEFRLARENGRTGVVIRTRGKKWGPDYVRFGLNFLDDFEGRSYFNLLGSYTRTGIDALGGEFRVDLQMGRTQRVLTEIYQPLDFRGRLFVAPSFEGTTKFQDFYQDDRRVAEYRTVSLLGGADVGARLGTIGEARVGARWGRSKTDVRTGAGGFPEYDVHHGEIKGRIVIDQIDNIGFPSEGIAGRADLLLARESIGAATDYDRLSGSLTLYRGFGRNTVSLGGAAGTNLGTQLPAYDRFLLGRPDLLSGYREGELSGQIFGGARLGFQRRGGRLLPVAGSYFYFGAWAEAGDAWERPEEIEADRLRFSGTVWFGADTILGPFRFAYGRAEGGHDHFSISLGRGF